MTAPHADPSQTGSSPSASASAPGTAKPSAKSAGVTNSGGRTDADSTGGRKWWRPQTLLLLAVVAFVAVAGSRIAEWLPSLKDRGEYRFVLKNIEVTPPPKWVPDTLVQEVLQTSALPESVSVLDESLNERLAAAFERHPWVRRVISIRKSVPARVRVQLEYREPLAVVRVGEDRVVPIDADGVVLPAEDLSLSFIQELPRVIGLESVPVPAAAGQVWSVPEIGATLSLLTVLRMHWEEFELAAVRVIVTPGGTPTASGAVAPPEPQFELLTVGGSRIRWGGAPDTQNPAEQPADEKIVKLQQYLRKFGGFDGPEGPYEIDVRLPHEIVRRPLNASAPMLRR